MVKLCYVLGSSFLKLLKKKSSPERTIVLDFFDYASLSDTDIRLRSPLSNFEILKNSFKSPENAALWLAKVKAACEFKDYSAAGNEFEQLILAGLTNDHGCEKAYIIVKDKAEHDSLIPLMKENKTSFPQLFVMTINDLPAILQADENFAKMRLDDYRKLHSDAENPGEGT